MGPALQIFRKYNLGIFLVIFFGAFIGLISAKEDYFIYYVALLCLPCAFYFIKKPELSLAVLFNGFVFYLYLAYKYAGETSSLITTLFIAGLAIFYLAGGIFTVIKNRKELRLDKVDVLMLVFIFLMLVSFVICSKDNPSAFKKLLQAPLLIIAPYMGARLLISNKKAQSFVSLSMLISVVLFIPSFYEMFIGGGFSSGMGRFALAQFDKGTNPILFGATFAVALMIFMVRLIEKGKLDIKLLIGALISLFLLVMSGSRGPVISFIVAALFYYLISLNKMKTRTKILSAVAIITIVMGIIGTVPPQVISTYAYTFTSEAQESEVSSVFQRLTMWKQSIEEFKESPILGVGFGNSAGGIGYPHNIVLEIGAEFGSLGLLILLLIVYFTWQEASSQLKIRKDRDLNILLKTALLFFVYSLTEAMFSGQITNQTKLFISIGLIVSLYEINRGSAKEQPTDSGKNEGWG
jgi:O-antigen ligase